jgi:hypothetical protein
VAVEARAVVVVVAHHEDEVDLATEVDVEDPEVDSAEVAVAAAASQEAVVAASARWISRRRWLWWTRTWRLLKLVEVALKPLVCARP